MRPGGVSVRAPSTVKVKGLFQTRKLGDTVQSYILQWDWVGNIKPQMDAAVALGANALHLSSVASSVKSGYVTQSQLLDRFKQQLDYCAAKLQVGVYVGLLYNLSDLTDTTNQATAAAVAGLCEGYPNILGFDICNEITGTASTIDAGMRAIVPALRAQTSRPLTASVLVANAATLTGTAVKALAPYVDFYDFHNYTGAGSTLVPADFTAFRASSYYKPWVVGESGERRASGSTAVRTRWNGNAVLSAEPDCFGAFGYTLIDFIDVTDDYGIYTSGSLGSSPDTDMTVPFASWPARL